MSTARGGKSKVFPPDARGKGYRRRSALSSLRGALGVWENTCIPVTAPGEALFRQLGNDDESERSGMLLLFFSRTAFGQSPLLRKPVSEFHF